MDVDIQDEEVDEEVCFQLELSSTSSVINLYFW